MDRKEKEQAQQVSTEDAKVAAGRKVVEEAMKRDALLLELAAKTVFRQGNVY